MILKFRVAPFEKLGKPYCGTVPRKLLFASQSDVPLSSSGAQKTIYNIIQLKSNANIEMIQRMQKQFGTKWECGN